MLAGENSLTFIFWKEFVGLAVRILLLVKEADTNMKRPRNGSFTDSVQEITGQWTLLYHYYFSPRQKCDHSVRLTCVAMDVCWCLSKFLALCALQVWNKLFPAAGHLKSLGAQYDAIAQWTWGFQSLNWKKIHVRYVVDFLWKIISLIQILFCCVL